MTNPSVRSWVAVTAVVYIAGLGFALWGWRMTQPQREFFLVYAENQAGCVIVMPERPTEGDRQAVELLRSTLAKASGMAVEHFPVRSSRSAVSSNRVRRIEFAPVATTATDPLQRGIGYSITPDRIVLSAEHAEDRGIAVSWFLEQELGARWFMPGALGLEIRRARTLKLAPVVKRTEPAYLSRNLGGMRSSEEKTWFRSNRLNALFQHGHTANRVFSPEAMARTPRMAPQVNGQPFLPSPGFTRWQPNLTSPASVEQAVRFLGSELRSKPAQLAAVFGQNDSWLWDQSDATLAIIAPHQHFRHYPDYSNTLFSFLNQVAEKLSTEFPDRFLTTYAYQWTENVPRFPVHPAVLPYLTTDRSQWFCPDYAEEDRELMRRWGKAGPRYFGIYDYYYGAPFFVPRPTLYAVAQPIPYAYGAGARGFYAECLPNWGLDGPKLWLAAQLLWDPAQSPEALIAEYYARYWQEAAAPMRAFFERCDRQYLEQPKPAYWLRYFEDDHQRLLFPPTVRDELRAFLDAAAQEARSTTVRDRVEFVRRSFALTELFCAHDETREMLNRRLFSLDTTTTEELQQALGDYDRARNRFITELARLERDLPLALRAEFVGDYSREDPRSVAWLELALRSAVAPLSTDAVTMVFAGRTPEAAELDRNITERLVDPELKTIRPRAGHPFTLVDWTQEFWPWQGRSEPYETLRCELIAQADGSFHLVFKGANQEGVYQHLRDAIPGALYHGRARVRAKVSPGNMTYLTVYFADQDGKHLGWGSSQRLPVGDWSEGVELQVLLRAPERAVSVHYALCTYWQVGDDFAEWSDFSLTEFAP